MKEFLAHAKKLSLPFFVSLRAPSSLHLQLLFLAGGLVLLTAGTSELAYANGIPLTNAFYNDARIAEAVIVLLTHVQGSFGALIMATAGILAILSAAIGQYRAALGLLVVAVGAFILRSIISTFFNDVRIGDVNVRN